MKCQYEGKAQHGVAAAPCPQEARYRVQYARCGLCGVVEAVAFCADHTALMRRLEAFLSIHCNCDDENGPSTPIEAVSLIAVDPQTCP